MTENWSASAPSDDGSVLLFMLLAELLSLSCGLAVHNRSMRTNPRAFVVIAVIVAAVKQHAAAEL